METTERADELVGPALIFGRHHHIMSSLHPVPGLDVLDRAILGGAIPADHGEQVYHPASGLMGGRANRQLVNGAGGIKLSWQHAAKLELGLS